MGASSWWRCVAYQTAVGTWLGSMGSMGKGGVYSLCYYFLLFHKSRTLYFMRLVQSTENDFMKELLDYRSPVRTETSAVL